MVFKCLADRVGNPEKAFPYLVGEFFHSSLMFAQTLDSFNIALLFVFNFPFKFTDLHRKGGLKNIFFYICLFYLGV